MAPGTSLVLLGLRAQQCNRTSGMWTRILTAQAASGQVLMSSRVQRRPQVRTTAYASETRPVALSQVTGRPRVVEDL